MKRRRNHFEREAWIMAAIVPAIIVIGVIVGIVVQELARFFGRHPH
jgi:uncharacterized membrane protein YcjF (UPF0283 family)